MTNLAALPTVLSGTPLDALATFAPDLYLPAPALLTTDEIRLATYQDQVGKARTDRYALYADYYDGRQRDPRAMTWNDDDLTRDRAFAARHNVCAPIVDIFVERLTVKGFGATLPDEQADVTTEVAKLLWRWWQLNRMDAYARASHSTAISLGDAYVLVEWDTANGLPRYCIEDPRTIRPVYDSLHRLEAVYKSWEEVTGLGTAARTRLRINKYRPGLIEKFVSDPAGLTVDYWTDDVNAAGQPDGGIIDWRDSAGDPLPIPIVHLRNMPRGSDFGRSELGDAIPMQDEFNRRVWATGQAAVFDGARIRFGINIQKFVDPTTGTERQPPVGPNAFWYITPDDPEKPAQVATLDTGDPAQLQEVADRQLKTIAGLLGIPVHLIWPGGGLPSGESLKTAEARLVSKLLDRAVVFGNAWEDVNVVALKLAETFGGLAVPAGLQLTTEWASVETRSALTDEQVIALKKDDLSRRQRMRERDYTEEEIDQIEAEKADEQAAQPPPPVPPVGAAAAAANASGANMQQSEAVADGVRGT